MPSRMPYDLVSDDGVDSRAFSEDAFRQGITFHVRFIGTLDVPRPQSRVEIVAAMRRIRFEFKAKAAKKRKVMLNISVDGVSIVLRRKVNKTRWRELHNQVIMHHPIYRVFYVSHDSQDLKIFSYIARDSQTNIFKCSVFKAYKKTEAMRIVRCVGQAFEVCHKLSQNKSEAEAAEEEDTAVSPQKSPAQVNKSSEVVPDATDSKAKSVEVPSVVSSTMPSAICATTNSPSVIPGIPTSDVSLSNTVADLNSLLLSIAAASTKFSDTTDYLTTYAADDGLNKPTSNANIRAMRNVPLAAFHAAEITRRQLEYQTQQTQIAISQVQYLKEQLKAETTARIEAHTRIHQLLIQNRDMLDHLNQLVHRIHQLEIASNHDTEEKKASAVVNSDVFLTLSNSKICNANSPRLDWTNNCKNEDDAEEAINSISNNNNTKSSAKFSTSWPTNLSSALLNSKSSSISHHTNFNHILDNSSNGENMSFLAEKFSPNRAHAVFNNEEDCWKNLRVMPVKDTDVKSQNSPDSGHKEMSNDSIVTASETMGGNMYRPSTLVPSGELWPLLRDSSKPMWDGSVYASSPSDAASTATHLSSLASLNNNYKDESHETATTVTANDKFSSIFNFNKMSQF